MSAAKLPKTPVDPHQNVSPIGSTHFDPMGQVSGASIAAKGGTPLRLSIAITMAQALASKVGPQNDTKVTAGIIADAFKYADMLIHEYNTGSVNGPGGGTP